MTCSHQAVDRIKVITIDKPKASIWLIVKVCQSHLSSHYDNLSRALESQYSDAKRIGECP